MSEELDDLLNQKENEGGAFQNPMIDQIKSEGLGSVDMDRFGPDQARSAKEILGWMAMDLKALPSRGKYYPSDALLQIRSARVNEIRYFSTVDESNLIDVEDKLNYIVSNCVQFKSGKKLLSSKDICEEDRIFVLLSIRDLTFPEPENKLIFKSRNKQGEEVDIELKSEYFQTTDIPEEIENYYDESLRAYKIRTKSAGEVIMRPPSIGIMTQVTEYIKEKEQNKKPWDRAFMQVFPYIQLDWRGMDEKRIFAAEIEFKSWDERKYMVIYRLAEKMKIGASAELVANIAGEEVRAQIDNFPGGIKSLFVIQDLSGELL